MSWAYNPNGPISGSTRRGPRPAGGSGLEGGPDGVRPGRQAAELRGREHRGEQERVQVLSFIQQQWKEIGVDASIRAVDVGTMWGRMLPQRQFEMAYSYTGRLPDPDMSTHYLSPELKPTTNFPGYANPEVDKLLLAATATVERDKRKAAYQRVQQIVADDAVHLFIYWLNGTTVLNKRVQGYKPAPGYNEFWNADEWWVQ